MVRKSLTYNNLWIRKKKTFTLDWVDKITINGGLGGFNASRK